MGKIKKESPPKITPVSIIRTIIFIAIVFLLINLVSGYSQTKSAYIQPQDITLSQEESQTASLPVKLPDISPYIPAYLTDKITGLKDTSAIIFVQDKINYFSGQLQGFPDNQIKELKKQILKQMYEDALKNI